MNKNINALTFLLVLYSIIGCVTPISLDTQLPVVDYTPKETLLVAVIDNRNHVKTAIGVLHGFLDKPSYFKIDEVFSLEKTDGKNDFSQAIKQRIVTGLQKKMWNVKAIDFEKTPAKNELNTLITSNRANKLIILQVNEWYFTMRLEKDFTIHFDADVDAFVYEPNKGQIFYKKFSENRSFIDESQSMNNTILISSREQLNRIFSEPGLKNILLTP